MMSACNRQFLRRGMFWCTPNKETAPSSITANRAAETPGAFSKNKKLKIQASATLAAMMETALRMADGLVIFVFQNVSGLAV